MLLYLKARQTQGLHERAHLVLQQQEDISDIEVQLKIQQHTNHSELITQSA